jgi:hypothetical protein
MSRAELMHPAAATTARHGCLTITRRDPVDRLALARRIRAEYEEMPGLNLTLRQAALLFGLQEDICAQVLRALIDERVLRRTETGRFMTAATPRDW